MTGERLQAPAFQPSGAQSAVKNDDAVIAVHERPQDLVGTYIYLMYTHSYVAVKSELLRSRRRRHCRHIEIFWSGNWPAYIVVWPRLLLGLTTR